MKLKLKRALRNKQMNPGVKVLFSNPRGLKLLKVILTEQDAVKLEELSHMKFGMTSCQVHRRMAVTRYFTCLEFKGRGSLFAVLCQKLHENVEMLRMHEKITMELLEVDKF